MEGEKGDGQAPDCQDDFKTDPLFHTVREPGQISEASMYSLSLPDPYTFFFLSLTQIYFLRNDCREGLDKIRWKMNIRETDRRK